MIRSRLFFIVGILTMVAFIYGCPSSKSVRDGFERKPGDLPLEDSYPRTVPPGAMRFTAKVVTVFTDRSTVPGDACATKPCVARIQVTMFLGFGHGVKGLKDGDFFRTQFAMTMADTTIDGKRYRGLSEGDTFTGTGYLLSTMDGQVLEVRDYE